LDDTHPECIEGKDDPMTHQNSPAPPPFDIFGPIDTFRDTALAASQKAKTATALHAFQAVQCYLNGITLQWNRIVSLTYGTVKRSLYFDLSQLEHQFYLVCWDMAEKYLSLFVKEENDKKIYVAFQKVRSVLHDASSARNYYEHSDRELKEIGLGSKGAGFSYPKGYHLAYPKVEKGRRVERTFDWECQESDFSRRCSMRLS